jgi:hypothetical protein
MNFVFIKCPNCGVKIKIDKDKKYEDCPYCKYEFRTADIPELAENDSTPLSDSLLDKLKKNLSDT